MLNIEKMLPHWLEAAVARVCFLSVSSMKSKDSSISKNMSDFYRKFVCIFTVPGHKSWSAGPFLKQNYPKYRLCEEDMGGSFRL